MDKALELADELEIAQGNNNADELIPEAVADMIRQQQAEISNLKAGLLSHHDIYPVKEQLTDEEIVNIGYHYGELGLNLEMIRAILRKASEK